MIKNKQQEPPLCKCGCGKEVKWNKRKRCWNKYLCGHNVRDLKTREKIRKTHTGMKRSKEHKKNMSKGKKGKTWEEIYGVKEARKRREKWSEAMRGENNPNYGKHPTKETLAKLSKTRKGKTWEEMYGEERAKKRRRRLKKQWQDPKYREKQLRAIARGSAKSRPTKPEKKLRRGLNKLFPNEYKYVGNGTFWIGGKNPDFMNINGQKKIIELFGTYWHSKAKTGRTKRQEESQRIRHFAKYGFQTLIVWQYELKNIKHLKKKLVEFHNI